eukprot:TRINITY_DN1658_c1_g1_i2.p1 TRINITY_DN1658_c1_g1~~TRINITY_DN1658_c1_g1_i2.p1  ORF type:complete len:481 (+),score=83.41 TRINITY_DN1658_c1_g1_i2:52-1443(+)
MLKTINFLAAVTTVGALVPVPPTDVITNSQRVVIEKAKAIAQAAQPQGKVELMNMLESDDYKRFMKELNSELAGKSSVEIHQLLASQLEVAEVVHNWSPDPFKQVPNIIDISLNSSVGYPYFFSNWQLAALGLNPPAKNTALQNTAEVELYHCNNFTQQPPNYTEASNRFPYGAMNIQKIAGGCPMFGPASTVFKNSYIRNQTILMGWDSGQIEMSCNKSLPNYINVTLNCSGFRPVGTFDFWEHAFVANAYMANTTKPLLQNVTKESHASYNLAMRVASFLSTDYSSIPNTTRDTSMSFIEANPMMNVEWDHGVKMLILSYRQNLFGTGQADALRSWAIKQNWVLIWSNDVDEHELSVSYRSNQRFVDPVVLFSIRAGKNYTSDPDIITLKDNFTTHYANVNQTLPFVPQQNLTSYYQSQWDISWNMFLNSKLQVEPLFANSCSNPDCAVVRVIDKACICDQ